MLIFQKLKNFYKRSAENRMGIFNILAFFVFPVVALALLYVFVVIFYLEK